MSNVNRHIFSILSLGWKRPGRCALIFLIMLSSVGLSLLLITRVEEYINGALGALSKENIERMVYEITALILSLSLVSGLNDFYVKRMMAEISSSLSRQVFVSILYNKMLYFENHSVGRLVSRIFFEVEEVAKFIQFVFSNLLKNLLILIIGLVLMSKIDSQLFVQSLLIVPLSIVSLFAIGGKISRRSIALQKSKASLAGLITETYNAIETVKIFSNEREKTRSINDFLTSVIEKKSSLNLVESMMKSLLIFLCFGSLVYLIWSGIFRVSEGFLTAGELMSFIGLFLMVAFSCASIGDTYSIFCKASNAYKKLLDYDSSEDNELINLGAASPFSNSVDHNNIVKLKENSASNCAIEITDVDFSYPSRPDKLVIDNLSLMVKKNTHTAFVGTSGGGKTTIIKHCCPVKE